MSDSQPAISFKQRFGAGVRRHAVALISLAVALFGTSYNTWRNQTTEFHRNVRSAGFMLLDQLGQLQEVTDRRFYGGDHSDANRINGWGKASLVRDMAMLVSAPTDARAHELFATWQANVDELETGDANAEQAISKAIAGLRDEVVQELRALN